MKKPSAGLEILTSSLALMVMLGGIYLSHRLEQPLSGIITGAAVLLWLGLLFLPRAIRKTGAEDTPAPETSDPEKEPDTYSGAASLYLEGFPNDRLYIIFPTENWFALAHVGNEASGIKESLVPARPLTDADKSSAGKKDIWIRKDELSAELKLKHNASTALPNCGTVTFRYGGKKKKFILLGEHDESALRYFFRELPSAQIAKTTAAARRDETAARLREHGRKMQAERNESLFPLLKAVMTVLKVVSVIAAVGTLFIAQPYRVWIVADLLLFVLAAVLTAAFPAYYTVLDINTNRSKPVYDVPMISSLVAFLPPLMALELRTFLDFNFLSFGRLLAAAAIFTVVFCAIMCLLLPELRISRGSFLPLLILVLLFSAGVPGEVNYLLDDPSPAHVDAPLVVDKHTSSGTNTPDTYYLTLEEDGGSTDLSVPKEYYDAIDPGDRVSIGYWNGALYIPYMEVLPRAGLIL